MADITNHRYKALHFVSEPPPKYVIDGIFTEISNVTEFPEIISAYFEIFENLSGKLK